MTDTPLDTSRVARYVDHDDTGTVTLVHGNRAVIVPAGRHEPVLVPIRTVEGDTRTLRLDRVQHLDLVTALLVALREVDLRDGLP